MAHADRVGVGKRQAKPACDLPMIFAHHVQLAAQILGRHLHARQHVAGQIVFERLVDHAWGAWGHPVVKLPAIIAICAQAAPSRGGAFVVHWDAMHDFFWGVWQGILDTCRLASNTITSNLGRLPEAIGES